LTNEVSVSRLSGVRYLCIGLKPRSWPSILLVDTFRCGPKKLVLPLGVVFIDKTLFALLGICILLFSGVDR